MTTRVLRSLVIATAVLVAGTTLIASPASASSTVPSPDGIFVVTVNNEGLDAGIARQAAADPNYRARALRLVEQWQAEMKAGQSPDLKSITTAGPVEGAQRLSQLKEQLGAPISPSSKTAGAVGATTSAVSPMISTLNPNTFPVAGWPEGDRSYWKYLKLTASARWCSTSGCGEPTDTIVCNLTVNPGAASSRIDASCGYFPNAGHFANKHLDLWAVNRGTVVGTKTTGNIFTGSGGSASYVLYSSYALNSSVLTVAAALWVYFTPNGQYLSPATGKTSDATCKPKGDNRCYY